MHPTCSRRSWLQMLNRPYCRVLYSPEPQIRAWSTILCLSRTLMCGIFLSQMTSWWISWFWMGTRSSWSRIPCSAKTIPTAAVTASAASTCRPRASLSTNVLLTAGVLASAAAKLNANSLSTGLIRIIVWLSRRSCWQSTRSCPERHSTSTLSGILRSCGITLM